MDKILYYTIKGKRVKKVVVALSLTGMFFVASVPTELYAICQTKSVEEGIFYFNA